MANDTLRFGTTTLGTGVLSWTPGTESLTPPAQQVGLYQEAAGVVSHGANRSYQLTVAIWISGSTQGATAAIIAEIQALATDTLADVYVIRSGVTVVRGYDCRLLPPPKVQVPRGGSGRFIEAWELTFVSETAFVFTG